MDLADFLTLEEIEQCTSEDNEVMRLALQSIILGEYVEITDDDKIRLWEAALTCVAYDIVVTAARNGVSPAVYVRRYIKS